MSIGIRVAGMTNHISTDEMSREEMLQIVSEMGVDGEKFLRTFDSLTEEGAESLAEFLNAVLDVLDHYDEVLADMLSVWQRMARAVDDLEPPVKPSEALNGAIRDLTTFLRPDFPLTVIDGGKS